jgi:hypothetical protein
MNALRSDWWIGGLVNFFRFCFRGLTVVYRPSAQTFSPGFSIILAAGSSGDAGLYLGLTDFKASVARMAGIQFNNVNLLS